MQVKNITAIMFQVNTADDRASVVRRVNEGFRVVALVEMRSHDKRGLLIAMLDEGIPFSEVTRHDWNNKQHLIFCAVCDFSK